MKKIFLILVVSSLLFNCKNDDDSNDSDSDFSELIVGEWSLRNTTPNLDCDYGWSFGSEGQFSSSDIDTCNNGCGGGGPVAHGGTYTIEGNSLVIVSGLTFVDCEIAFDDNSLLVYFDDDDSILSFDSEDSPLVLSRIVCD
ncbi:hypothetical protein [Winogradskyella sp.]|jgi:hypothetical protein|uniref:hypothetical protein n=1 Tax=Winogradskyella sp. TaxID=1883156 RepID=UPI0025FC9102|nr:hypothetical protein [Winogradskyella sp.]MCT4630562.1 hypothetical protein [Winogradskyella sp.]